MRELKFRIWDTSLEEFIDYNHPKTGAMLYDNTIAVSTGWNSKKQPTWDWGEVDLSRYEFDQFTGLKDKNGKDIYEGDIINYISQYRRRTYTGEIIYSGSGFTAKSFYMPHHDNPSDVFEQIEWIEVIGNIHENKDLLK